MALVLKSAVTINALGTEIYIEFVEATGLYDADDNIGGFGSPNPDRNDLAVFLFAEHKKVAGDVLAQVLAYNPESVTSFTIEIDRSTNGVINFVILAIPVFDSGATYEDGNVVYDVENPAEPFIKEMVAGVFVPREVEELIENETITRLDDYTFAIPDAIKFSNLLNAEKLKMLRDFVYDKCERGDYEPLRDRFEYVDGLIKTATNAYCAQAYNEAQVDLEEVFKYGIEIAVLDE